MRRVLVVAALIAGVVAFPLPAPAVESGRCDFDGDGYDDAAIGIPRRRVELPLANSGAVHIIYGSANKLTAKGDQQFHQDTPGIADSAESHDQFGASFACGNFNGDGFDDLAIGASREDRGGQLDVGVVHVLYGSASGLSTIGADFLHRKAQGVAGGADPSDFFGESLAAGDFDGDGRDDLAVAVPGDDAALLNAGSVQVFYGASTGISTSGDQIWHRDTPGIKGKAEGDPAFGRSLAAGDFDKDGHDDLVIGSPWDDIGNQDNAGSISVIYGSKSGLTSKGDDLFHRNSDGIKNSAKLAEEFGAALAVGDFDGDTYDDVAVGVPDDTVKGESDAGSIHIIRGGPGGLHPGGDKVISRATTGIKGKPEEDARFGSAITAARFNSGKKWDLAVGMGGDDVDGIPAAGRVQVIYSGGLSGTRDEFWHQGVKGVKGKPEWADAFGSALNAGDFDRNGKDDLLAGVHSEDTVEVDAGIVAVIYGKNDGLSAAGDQIWSLDSPGIKTDPQEFDFFGIEL